MSDDLLAKRKYVDHRRFRWHEAILKHPDFDRRPSVLKVAGYIMHRCHRDLGYAEFSNNSAAEYLGLDPRTIARAKKHLVKQGWIRLLFPANRRGQRWSANKYILGGGPEDLLFDTPSTEGGSDAAATVPSPTNRS